MQFCVEPKMLHLLRAMPPDADATTAHSMDLALQQAFAALVGVPQFGQDAREQLSLPIRVG
eukprot:12411576-Karenia_brevis.AAC.1